MSNKSCRKCIYINECKLRKGLREINQDNKLGQYLIFPEDLAKICFKYKE